MLNGGCEGGCARTALGGVRCVCAAPLRLAEDGRACEPPPSASAPACAPLHFHCAEGPCLPRELLCDSVRHCSDAPTASDENYAYCCQ